MNAAAGDPSTSSTPPIAGPATRLSEAIEVRTALAAASDRSSTSSGTAA